MLGGTWPTCAGAARRRFSEHGGEHESAGEARCCARTGSARAPPARRVAGGAPPGGARARRAARRRPQRNGQGGGRRAAHRRRQRRDRRRPGARNSTGAAIRAGAVMLPEDRKSEGIVPNLSVRETSCWPAGPGSPVPGWWTGPNRTRSCAPSWTVEDPRGQPGTEGQRAVRRQPAEGHAGPLAVPETRRCCCSTSDQGHRRRGQGGGAGSDRRVGRRRAGRRTHLLRSGELIEGSDRVLVLRTGGCRRAGRRPVE